MGDTPSDPSCCMLEPWSQASILLGMGTSAREWISLSSTGDLDSTSACLWARTSSFSSTLVLTYVFMRLGSLYARETRNATII